MPTGANVALAVVGHVGRNGDRQRIYTTADGRFTVRGHPTEQGLLIEPEDWSIAVVSKVVAAGLDFHARNITQAGERLLEIYDVLGWEP